jgi:hypothetical protein
MNVGALLKIWALRWTVLLWIPTCLIGLALANSAHMAMEFIWLVMLGWWPILTPIFFRAKH